MEKFFSPDRLDYLYDGISLAHVLFKIEDGCLCINSTSVDSSLRGQGIARQMMEDIEAYCQKRGYKIKASCSYALKHFSSGEHPLWIG